MELSDYDIISIIQEARLLSGILNFMLELKNLESCQSLARNLTELKYWLGAQE